MEKYLICESALVEEAAKASVFPSFAGGDEATGFVVRLDGPNSRDLNRCAHVPVELD